MSVVEALVYLTYLAAGAVLGILVMPWRRELSSMRGSSFITAWVFLWPFLLCSALMSGLKAYRAKWVDYLSTNTKR